MRGKSLNKPEEAGFFRALKTALSAMFGVQSQSNWEKDQRELSWVMVAAAMIISVATFVIILRLIVHLVLINH